MKKQVDGDGGEKNLRTKIDVRVLLCSVFWTSYVFVVVPDYG